MNDFTLFLGKFFKHGTAIASVAPIEPLAIALDGSKHRLGPGNGRLVELGARHRADHAGDRRARSTRCRVVVVERDPDFARLLRERFRRVAPNFEIVQGDVRDLRRSSASVGSPSVDHVVSGLPVPSFSRGLAGRAVPGRRRRAATATGRSTRSPRYPGSTGGFTGGISQTFGSCSSRATCRPPGAYFCRGMRVGS